MDEEEKKSVKPKKVLTEEQKKEKNRKKREYMRKRCREDAEYRAKETARNREYRRKRMQEDPEYRAKRSAHKAEYYRKRCQEDPEYRSKENARRRERLIAAKARVQQQQQSGEQTDSSCSIPGSSNSMEPTIEQLEDCDFTDNDDDLDMIEMEIKDEVEDEVEKFLARFREYIRKRYQTDPEYRAKINARQRERRIEAKARVQQQQQQPGEQSESNISFSELKPKNVSTRPEPIQPPIKNQPEPKIKEKIEAKQSLLEKKSGAESASLEQSVKMEIEEDSSTKLDLAKMDQEIREDLEAFWYQFYRARLESVHASIDNPPESKIGQGIDENSDDDDSVDFDLIDQLMREEGGI